jgi:hypothetical protein
MYMDEKKGILGGKRKNEQNQNHGKSRGGQPKAECVWNIGHGREEQESLESWIQRQ